MAHSRVNLKCLQTTRSCRVESTRMMNAHESMYGVYKANAGAISKKLKVAAFL